MPESALHLLHLSIAEQGKIYLLEGRHGEALRHFREAIRIAVAAHAPEVFFRHYTQCVLESLELSGDYEEIITFCRNADAHYAKLESDEPIVAKDHGATLERLGVALLLSDRRDEAAETLDRAVVRAGPGQLPFAEAVATWLGRGLAVPLPVLRQAQRRHNYFAVRRETVQRALARPMPAGSGRSPAAVLG